MNVPFSKKSILIWGKNGPPKVGNGARTLFTKGVNNDTGHWACSGLVGKWPLVLARLRGQAQAVPGVRRGRNLLMGLGKSQIAKVTRYFVWVHGSSVTEVRVLFKYIWGGKNLNNFGNAGPLRITRFLSHGSRYLLRWLMHTSSEGVLCLTLAIDLLLYKVKRVISDWIIWKKYGAHYT
jgi:hypothetical protein